MSVLIQGMDMPTAGTVMSIYKLNGKFYASVHGTELCPLVPVPPHGRLIDADALKPYMLNEHYKYRLVYDANEVANAPTIIPSEPPKEET